MQIDIIGVGLLSAGLEGWDSGREVLSGRRPFDRRTLSDPEGTLLPPNERRRSTASVRWAVQVANEAIAHSGLDPAGVATVFASSGGEMGVLDQLCRALTTPERVISPTLFHQSVHNTAAGYWGIATSCQQSSTALSCYDDSCAAGLLEAAAYAVMEECPVLFVSYDLPAPDPLIRARPIQSAFAAALILTMTP
jgi:3-oxoacyl-(acyl-carrier-protein) synthase